MANVVIFGVGQLAEVAHFYITNDSEHNVVAFCVDRDYLKDNEFCGLPVVAYEDIEISYPPSDIKLFMPISYVKVNKVRKEKFEHAKSIGYDFISYISSKATYYGTPVGENCFIFENNVIQPFTSIGDNCILWSGNHVGHHSKIGSHCFIASHVVISGSVEIGDLTFMGVNSTVRDNVSIGIENVIGAGSLILDNTDNRAVYSPKGTEKSRVPSNRLRGI
jgi:sugar O-acyltransferase (sialic acid O-acetyltransferase NeuD family)